MNSKKPLYSLTQQQIIEKIQVNIPFTMLVERQWQDLFFNSGLNPEIGLAAEALDAFSLSDFKGFADRFHNRNRSITIHGPFMDLSPGSPDPKIRELTVSRFKQLIDAVSVFKPKTVVCHAGYEHARYGFCKEKWLEHAVDTWKWLGKELYDRGTRLMLENVYETDPAELMQVIDPLDPAYIGYCLDVGHLASFGKYPLDQWLNATGKYIGQLHLHDNYGDHDSHLGMGKGSINFDPLFEYIKRMTKKPVVTLEPHEQEDFIASLAFLEQSDFLSLFS
ncbi:MAG: sugar phosphate isomerase/epimerase [Desulfobacteraceae bacterium]|nr:sugar phosphate isomerase/epimerase [Desulfobacteraceae bacterium]MBC2755065.1 sugar phosphate isomerase/epimerase [Desulfobacteraceae bacterium]